MNNTTKREKKFFVLKDRGGDLGKQWYIEFYAPNRRRSYGNINTGKTAAERKKLAAAHVKVLRRKHKPPAPNRVEVAALYEMLEFERPQLEKKSYQTYKTKIDSLARWLDGDLITEDRMRLYFKLYRESHTQQGTYDCRRQLQTFFKKAGMGHILDPIKIKKGQSQPLRYFQKHQRKQILEHLKTTDPQLFLHCVFIYFTGIRPRKELVRIRVDDIFWHKRKIAVRGEFSKNHKTEYVPIVKSFEPFIEHLQMKPPGHYIFPAARDERKPAGRNTYGQRFRDVLDSMGYGKDYQLYSWKHTGAVEVYQKTKNIIALQRWARHSDVKTTQLYLRQLGIEDFEDFYEHFPPPL